MRSRNIKPAFFKNEELGLIDPLARLLYIGLWCYCDRNGRFEWRPLRIKAEILPYDDCNINELLNILIKADEIKRYEVDGKQYGFIPTFLNHQNPHMRENPSIYPPFEEKHNLGIDKAQPRQEPARLNPESLILNPESLILNPESSNMKEKHNLGTDEAQPRQCFLESYKANGIEFKLANLLFSLIKERNPNHKRPNMDEWTRQIDLMIRRDNRHPENIKRVIDWCQKDDFWQNNILSTKKLRQQYDQLFLKMTKNKQPKWQVGIDEWLRIRRQKNVST